MQGAPTRYVSVSELYSTDEVELLLDEIRDLEPTSCRGEDLQDLEIAGSGCAGGGGRSPAGTELTERSWDSHAQYTRGIESRAPALAPLYCRPRLLLSPRGALAALLVACSAATCACVWAAAGLRVRLPLADRLRALLFAALSSALLHTGLLTSRVTRLRVLLPIDWNALELGTALWSALSLSGGAAATLHALLAEPEYRQAPGAVADLLHAAAGLALTGAAAALVLVVMCTRVWRARRSEYRAVPVAPPAATLSAPPMAPAAVPSAPSTSRDDRL